MDAKEFAKKVAAKGLHFDQIPGANTLFSKSTKRKIEKQIASHSISQSSGSLSSEN